MRQFIVIAILVSACGCAHERSNAAFKDGESYRHQLTRMGLPGDWVKDFVRDLRSDFPLRAGMRLSEARRLIESVNDRVTQADPLRTNVPPIYSRSDLHLYRWSEWPASESTRGGNSISFWINGRHQYWADMAIDQGILKNIFIIPGNMSE